MRVSPTAAVFVMGCLPMLAQAPAGRASASPAGPSAASISGDRAPVALLQVEDAKIGFSSSLPSDWQGVAAAQRRNDVPYPAAVAPKKGDACVEVEMTARHGNSASVIVVLALPFACYGQTMTASDLKNFGEGVAEGLKQTFTILKQAQGSYSLGSHALWIERADGTPKRLPESPYTFEIACTVVGKGAACWMTMAADAASLHDFEQQAVTLEGDRFAALVPAGAAPVVPEAAAKKAP